MGAHGRSRRGTDERRRLRAESERPRNNEQGDPAKGLAVLRSEILEERGGRVGGQLCAVECRGWEPSQGFGESFRREGPGLGERAAAKTLGEHRSASYRGGAPAAEEARFRDTAVRDAGGELEDVAADGIAYLDGRGCARKLAGVSRVAEVIENGFAEHEWKYPKGSAGTATQHKSRKHNAETQSSQRAEIRNRQECLFHKKIYFFVGKNFFSTEATTT